MKTVALLAVVAVLVLPSMGSRSGRHLEGKQQHGDMEYPMMSYSTMDSAPGPVSERLPPGPVSAQPAPGPVTAQSAPGPVSEQGMDEDAASPSTPVMAESVPIEEADDGTEAADAEDTSAAPTVDATEQQSASEPESEAEFMGDTEPQSAAGPATDR